MYLLLSGEGPGDIGRCNNGLGQCEMPEYQPGPMAHIVDKLVELQLGYDYSYIEYAGVTFMSKQHLVDNKLPSAVRPIALRGKKKPPETQYYFENARALAAQAKALSERVEDKVIAVLFRDADGTASAGRGHWKDKVNSMLKGFEAEDYVDLGVPMIPKPKSEAWLMCALKPNPYQHCEILESESGNDQSANPLKDQLAELLNGDSNTLVHNDLIAQGTIDVSQIDMTSFNHFKAKLHSAVAYCQQDQS